MSSHSRIVIPHLGRGLRLAVALLPPPGDDQSAGREPGEGSERQGRTDGLCGKKISLQNAAIDLDNYIELAARIEFSDLRELQDIITSKATWAKFEPRFANKQTLRVKFDQLAELRNGIRHSRKVDAITRKEGEAAILWFQKVLDT